MTDKTLVIDFENQTIDYGSNINFSGAGRMPEHSNPSDISRIEADTDGIITITF